MESSWEVINEASDRSACLARYGCCEIVIAAHSGNSIQMGIFRPISPLRSAKDPQGNTMKRVKGVENLNICMIGTQGIVGVGAIIHTSI